MIETGQKVGAGEDRDRLDLALRMMEQTGAVRRIAGGWVHEAQPEAQAEAERLLAARFGPAEARSLIEQAIENTSVETPPDHKEDRAKL